MMAKYTLVVLLMNSALSPAISTALSCEKVILQELHPSHHTPHSQTSLLRHHQTPHLEARKTSIASLNDILIALACNLPCCVEMKMKVSYYLLFIHRSYYALHSQALLLYTRKCFRFVHIPPHVGPLSSSIPMLPTTSKHRLAPHLKANKLHLVLKTSNMNSPRTNPLPPIPIPLGPIDRHI